MLIMPMQTEEKNMPRRPPKLFLAVLGLVFALSTTLLAASTFKGTIQSVGPGTISVMAKDAAIQTYRVDPAASIVRNAKPASLSKLRTGDVVTITTELKNSKPVAVAIVARAAM